MEYGFLGGLWNFSGYFSQLAFPKQGLDRSILEIIRQEIIAGTFALYSRNYSIVRKHPSSQIMGGLRILANNAMCPPNYVFLSRDKMDVIGISKHMVNFESRNWELGVYCARDYARSEYYWPSFSLQIIFI